MSIHRIQSGLIFDDSFETFDTSRWVMSHSNAYAYSEEEKSLSLFHNQTDRSTNALFSLPQEEDDLLLQIKADFTPTKLGDEGGLVVWKNALEKVEFLESEDTTQIGEYSVWRVIKRQNLWTFFAERNQSWELFDSTIMIDPTMAGAVLKGTPKTGYVPLALERVILCKGAHISVGNINSGYKVELIDFTTNTAVREQIVPEGYSGIDIELPTIPFRGRLKIYDTDGAGGHILIDDQKEYADMYGGDIFLRGTDLKVLWDGVEISEVTPTHLGAMKHDEIELKMTVLNDTTGNVAENVTISIAAYDEEFGWEWCDLAEDSSGTPGTYQDLVIPMGTLRAGDSKDFWVKITRATNVDPTVLKKQMRPTYFFLEIKND